MNEAPAAIDGTAVEEQPEVTPPESSLAPPATPGQAPPVGTELATLPPGAGAIISADQPEEILAKAHQIAKPLADLIEQAGLSKNLGGSRKHVEVGGWQAAGAMLGALGGQALHAETVWTRRDEPSEGWEACVEVRTAAGVVVGRAEAMCSRAESNWSNRDDYALRSMAETRAESRAFRRAIGWIVHLAGYNPTPAEEMGHTPGAQPAELPAWALEATAERKKLAHGALSYLLGDSPTASTELLKGLRETLGVPMPEVVAIALSRIAKGVQDARAGTLGARAAAAGPADASEESPPAGADASPPAAKRPAAPGTVDSGLKPDDDAAVKLEKLRAHGCTCGDPLGPASGFNSQCPIEGMGIPF